MKMPLRDFPEINGLFALADPSFRLFSTAVISENWFSNANNLEKQTNLGIGNGQLKWIKSSLAGLYPNDTCKKARAEREKR